MDERVKLVREKLGFPGTMVSFSKSAYSNNYPTHVTVFNSNVCTPEGKVWFGDIDVTKDGAKLKELAKELGTTLYVLREMDGRFENEQSPRIDKAVVMTDGKTLAVGPEYISYYEVRRGKIYVKKT